METTTTTTTTTIGVLDAEVENGFTISIGKWFGIPVRIHGTFFILSVSMIIIHSVLHRSWMYSLLQFIVYCPVLFLTAVAHKACQVVLYNKYYGSTCHKIILWPLGGWALFKSPNGTIQQDFRVALVGPISHIPHIVIWLLVMTVSSTNGFHYFIEVFNINTFKLGGTQYFFAELGKQGIILNLLLFGFNLVVPSYPMDSTIMLSAFLIQKYGLDITTVARFVGLIGGIMAAIMSMIGIVGISTGLYVGPAWFLLLVGLFLILSSSSLITITTTLEFIKDHPIFKPDCYNTIPIVRSSKLGSGSTNNNNNNYDDDDRNNISISQQPPLQPIKSILKTSSSSNINASTIQNSNKTIETLPTFTTLETEFDEESPTSWTESTIPPASTTSSRTQQQKRQQKPFQEIHYNSPSIPISTHESNYDHYDYTKPISQRSNQSSITRNSSNHNMKPLSQQSNLSSGSRSSNSQRPRSYRSLSPPTSQRHRNIEPKRISSSSDRHYDIGPPTTQQQERRRQEQESYNDSLPSQRRANRLWEASSRRQEQQHNRRFGHDRLYDTNTSFDIERPRSSKNRRFTEHNSNPHLPSSSQTAVRGSSPSTARKSQSFRKPSSQTDRPVSTKSLPSTFRNKGTSSSPNRPTGHNGAEQHGSVTRLD